MNKVIKNNEKYVEHYTKTQLTKRSVGQHIYSQKFYGRFIRKLLHNYVEWTANKEDESDWSEANL